LLPPPPARLISLSFFWQSSDESELSSGDEALFKGLARRARRRGGLSTVTSGGAVAPASSATSPPHGVRFADRCVVEYRVAHASTLAHSLTPAFCVAHIRGAFWLPLNSPRSRRWSGIAPHKQLCVLLEWRAYKWRACERDLYRSATCACTTAMAEGQPPLRDGAVTLHPPCCFLCRSNALLARSMDDSDDGLPLFTAAEEVFFGYTSALDGAAVKAALGDADKALLASPLATGAALLAGTAAAARRTPLPCLALPCFALPCLALPCLASPCLALPCLALPCLTAARREVALLCVCPAGCGCCC
jgi:hypothetical protein